MVSAPASSPCLDSSFRSRRITSSVSASTACGLECGRRDRGSKGGNTLGVETFDQQLHPEPGNPVVPGHLTLGPALHSDRGNDQLSHRHVAPPKKRCQLCPETGANYVVQPVTLGSTLVRATLESFDPPSKSRVQQKSTATIVPL